jgi:polyphosphate kinase
MASAVLDRITRLSRGDNVDFEASVARYCNTLPTMNPIFQEHRSRYFDDEISPALTPLVFNPAHAFPFLSNLSISLAFLLHDPQKETSSYARVKIPAILKQWIPVETDVPAGQNVFVPLYDVIRGNIHKLYSGMKLTGTTLFRLTRDAEVEIDDESDEALEDVVREQIRQRRYEPVVRLEFAPGSDPSIREMLRARFKLAPTEVYDLPGELDYTSLFQIFRVAPRTVARRSLDSPAAGGF